MSKDKTMTAEEAFEKTKELVRAYEEGDLHGGNPMQYIEKYANQTPKALSDGLYDFNEFWMRLMPDEDSSMIEVDWHEVAGEIESIIEKREAHQPKQTEVDLEKVFKYIEQVANECGTDLEAVMVIARVQCKDYLQPKEEKG